eukprot:TRINITY_DN1630_c0_g1_i3.p1 TRINITY_DN1630_c0_g1~~TRINITY_DN1630_c0_g1_i3.p1  ORF type:complete len:227 (-),score=51.48 TRINITY_DN1630_c0_g1_i3:42-722(-)
MKKRKRPAPDPVVTLPLPLDIWKEIITFLDASSFLQLRRVCKKFNDIFEKEMRKEYETLYLGHVKFITRSCTHQFLLAKCTCYLKPFFASCEDEIGATAHGDPIDSIWTFYEIHPFSSDDIDDGTEIFEFRSTHYNDPKIKKKTAKAIKKLHKAYKNELCDGTNCKSEMTIPHHLPNTFCFVEEEKEAPMVLWNGHHEDAGEFYERIALGEEFYTQSELTMDDIGY